MGLTRERARESEKRPAADFVVALAGSPNVGKSTVFNALTGLHRHTGNWTGKTVSLAYGVVRRERSGGASVALVDLPGSVSLCPESPEEKVSADFLASGEADAAIIVCDALALERNLIFVLAAAPRVRNCVLCVNMIDEAKRAGVTVDALRLSERTGLPVVLCAARSGRGVDALIPTALSLISQNSEQPSPATAPEMTTADPDRAPEASAPGLAAHEANAPDHAALAASAREIAHDCTSGDVRISRASRVADRILTGRISGPLAMIALLAAVFWITAVGANIPSDSLAALFARAEDALRFALTALLLPPPLVSCLVDGVFRVAAWVTSVMLPPMAIFFPLFTLAEDVGLFPRVAFDLDRSFARCKSCGRHAITSVMGLGCNAVGVCGCRIISSPRRRRTAILTNSFIPCNGRIGAIFLITSTFLARTALGESAVLVAVFAFALAATFAASALLGTRSRGEDEPFILEMVRFRRPQIARTLVRSFFDRTLFVLGRALAVAAPAGAVIWLASNVTIAGATPVEHIVAALEPVGRALGVDGTLLCAFILGLPANEIVLPLAAAIYSHGALSQSAALGETLAAAGWTVETALCALALTVLHSPCATTLLTIRRETGSAKTALAAALLPSVFGVAACLLIRAVFAIFG